MTTEPETVEPERPTRRGLIAGLPRPPWLSARTELLVVAVLVVVAVVVTALMARDMWFLSDEWEYLANRSVTDLDSMLRPYGGHWTTVPTILIRGLNELFGIDFWPWYYIPRLIGHTALALMVWWTVRRRGLDPVLGLITLAVLLFLSASSYQRALQVGNWVVYAALIVTATMIERHARPSVRQQVVVAVALLVGVLGNGYAVAVLVGTTAAVLLARRLRTWLPALLPALLAYATWYLVYRDDIEPKPDLNLEKILLIPIASLRIVRGAVTAVTGLPSSVAVVLVLVLVAWVVSLALRRKLDIFDGIMIATLLTGLALLAIQRVAEHPEAAGRERYGYSVTVLLVLLIVPHLRLPTHRVAAAVVVAFGLFAIGANVVDLDRAIDINEDTGQLRRVRVEAGAVMMNAGEPVVPGPSEVVRRLDTLELQSLVDHGYSPSPSVLDSELEALVTQTRGNLRMRVVEPGAPRPRLGPPPNVPGDDSCAAVWPGRRLDVEVQDGGGALQVVQDAPNVIDMIWTDEFGRGRVTFYDARPRVGIELADPGPAGAEIAITVVTGRGFSICALGA